MTARMTLLELSTAHVSKDTADWLDHEGEIAANIGDEWGACQPKLHMARHRYGWFVFVDEQAGERPGDGSNSPKERRPDDIPADLWTCMGKACDEGYDYILFDRDVPTNPDLAVFEW